jgi:glycosyltransferase involved in cell wall biosynthesis
MNIQMVTQENFQWVKGFTESFKEHNLYITDRIDIKRNTDVFMFMWANQEAIEFINRFPSALGKLPKFILFIRRYEMFTPWINKLNVNKVDKIIMVNDYLAENFETMFHVKPYVIYNGVSVDEWSFKERSHGNKISMIGYITPKKGHLLGLQILESLSRDYELHILGAVQDACLFYYMSEFIKTNKLNVKFYNRLPHNQVNEWLDDKDYILSCSYSEGNPNNVIEAMAKGIKPIVHNWPGAENQFNHCIFNSIQDACNMINPMSQYNSELYRQIVINNFGDAQFIKVKELVESA